MSDIIIIAGIAIAAAGAAILLKQYKPEYAFGISVAAGVLLIFFIVTKALLCAKTGLPHKPCFSAYSANGG